MTQDTIKEGSSPKKVPLLWASALRIFACALIFIYHYLVLHGQSTGLGTIGLYIFFFLAGWFAGHMKRNPKQWIVGRLRRLLIPYWPVIFVVLVANHIVHYKDTTLLKDVLTFCGLSLFVDNPVYVISWFITMAIILDASLCIFTLIKPVWMRAGWLVLVWAGFYFFLPLLVNALYLFYLGIFIRRISVGWFSLNTWFSEKSGWYRKINSVLFHIQNYTYSFFLIHGAALIFVFHVLHFRSELAFLSALAFSIFGTIVHNRLLRRFA